MTEFQQLARTHLDDLFAKHAIETEFSPLPGHPDPFNPTEDRTGHLRAEINGPHGLVQVYLYRDEAGFHAGRNWFVFEKQRYASPNALIDDFVSTLSDWVAR